MNILMNIIVLIFEVLYYSMFMYYTKKEGKFWKYILLFSLISIVLMFVGTKNLYSYLVFVVLSLFGLKYIIKAKASLYDMLIIIIMIFFKIFVEASIFFINNLFIKNYLLFMIMIVLIKFILVCILRKRLNTFYIKLKNKWDKNNFYIRYIFICLTYIYIIITIILLIFYR